MSRGVVRHCLVVCAIRRQDHWITDEASAGIDDGATTCGGLIQLDWAPRVRGELGQDVVSSAGADVDPLRIGQATIVS